MIRIDKVTLNVGVGGAGEKLEKAKTLLQKVSGQKPVETYARKRIPTWNLRKGLAIGCKVTLRGQKAVEILNRTLTANEKRIRGRSFDNTGNVCFGVKEYIDVPGMKYDPAIGMMGMDVCVSLEKHGYRVKRRKRGQASVNTRITPEEAIEFMKSNFGVEIGG
jgi:large subunit ribosomal protein L5